jgi:hypothetical protein
MFRTVNRYLPYFDQEAWKRVQVESSNQALRLNTSHENDLWTNDHIACTQSLISNEPLLATDVISECPNSSESLLGLVEL